MLSYIQCASILPVWLLAMKEVTAFPMKLSLCNQHVAPITVPMALQPYTINITIGSQAVPYNALLDSGSAALVLPTTNCTTDGSVSC